MKILCDRQELQDAFAVVGGIPPLKTTKPIIQNVFVRAGKDHVELQATDEEMSARVVLASVKVTQPGAALLPAREASALLRELSHPTLTLRTEDSRTVIESGSGSFELVGDDPDLFPTIGEFDEDQRVEVVAGKFIAMIRQTAFAVAREETRFAINGVCLDLKDGILRLVGTDGRRLATSSIPAVSSGKDIRRVVPIRVLSTLSKAIDDDDQGPLQIVIGDNRIAFQTGRSQLVSRLLENRYPDYDGVIPRAAETTIDIDRAELERNLRRVAVLSSGDVRMVHFHFSDSSLRMQAESSGVGKAELSMEVHVNGPGGGISFNPDYVIDALKVAETDVVQLEMTDDSTPAKMRLGESYVYVLMPISGS